MKSCQNEIVLSNSSESLLKITKLNKNKLSTHGDTHEQQNRRPYTMQHFPHAVPFFRWAKKACPKYIYANRIDMNRYTIHNSIISYCVFVSHSSAYRTRRLREHAAFDAASCSHLPLQLRAPLLAFEVSTWAKSTRTMWTSKISKKLNPMLRLVGSPISKLACCCISKRNTRVRCRSSSGVQESATNLCQTQHNGIPFQDSCRLQTRGSLHRSSDPLAKHLVTYARGIFGVDGTYRVWRLNPGIYWFTN